MTTQICMWTITRDNTMSLLPVQVGWAWMALINYDVLIMTNMCKTVILNIHENVDPVGGIT